jgi:hypothetical protein
VRDLAGPIAVSGGGGYLAVLANHECRGGNLLNPALSEILGIYSGQEPPQLGVLNVEQFDDSPGVPPAHDHLHRPGISRPGDHPPGCNGFQAGSPQAPEVSDHGLLQKLEDDEEEKDRSNHIQRCTAGVAPSRIPLVTRCRPRCLE